MKIQLYKYLRLQKELGITKNTLEKNQSADDSTVVVILPEKIAFFNAVEILDVNADLFGSTTANVAHHFLADNLIKTSVDFCFRTTDEYLEFQIEHAMQKQSVLWILQLVL